MSDRALWRDIDAVAEVARFFVEEWTDVDGNRDAIIERARPALDRLDARRSGQVAPAVAVVSAPTTNSGAAGNSVLVGEPDVDDLCDDIRAGIFGDDRMTGKECDRATTALSTLANRVQQAETDAARWRFVMPLLDSLLRCRGGIMELAFPTDPTTVFTTGRAGGLVPDLIIGAVDTARSTTSATKTESTS